MRKIKFNIFAVIFFSLITFVGGVGTIYAEGGIDAPTTGTGGIDAPTTDGDTTGTTDGDVNKFGVTIRNPLRSDIDTFPELVEEILRLVVLIAVPILVLAVIYTGFLFVKAQGDEKGLSKAKDTLLGVVIGAALILGAWVIAEAIQGTVEDLGATTPTVDGGATGGGAVFGTD